MHAMNTYHKSLSIACHGSSQELISLVLKQATTTLDLLVFICKRLREILKLSNLLLHDTVGELGIQ